MYQPVEPGYSSYYGRQPYYTYDPRGEEERKKWLDKLRKRHKDNSRTDVPVTVTVEHW